MALSDDYLLPTTTSTLLVPGSEQYPFQYLLSKGFGTEESRKALEENHEDPYRAEKWLRNGGMEVEEGEVQHVRMRLNSQWDPSLAKTVSNGQLILKYDRDDNESDVELSRADSVTTETPDVSDVPAGKEADAKISKLSEKGFTCHSGYLEKNSPSVLKGWQSRWFYLWDTKIDYFKESNAVQKGSVNLMEIGTLKVKGNLLNIKMIEKCSTPNRMYELRAKTSEDALQWRIAIDANRLRIHSHGWPIQKIKVDDSLSIDVKNLHMQAHTGDVLLFCSKHYGGKIVQGYTQSHFDHIGLLIRYGKNQVSVLEALGKHGVQLFNWKDFIRERWYEQYTDLALRRLYIPDKKLRRQMLQTIASFVKEVVNCTYSWTPVKMMRRKSVAVSKLSERTFFCSEVVAKAYKECGILREDCPSSAYTPAMFDESNNLQLLRGCRLLKEQKITFVKKTEKS